MSRDLVKTRRSDKAGCAHLGPKAAALVSLRLDASPIEKAPTGTTPTPAPYHGRKLAYVG